jgi:hypothetical protein
MIEERVSGQLRGLGIVRGRIEDWATDDENGVFKMLPDTSFRMQECKTPKGMVDSKTPKWRFPEPWDFPRSSIITMDCDI